MIKIGVTGTREGMTEYQRKMVTEFLLEIVYPGDELHHGDCIGVDEQVATIAANNGFTTISYPPIIEHMRAFHKSDEILTPTSYFARNRNIVDAVNFLIVVPREMEHQPRGGTWYTHDYAIKIGKNVKIFWPEPKESSNSLFD